MNNSHTREFKDKLYGELVRICKALANGHRLELLSILSQGEYSVESLAKETGMSVANTSQHLQTLRAAQLVEVRRRGVYARYRIADNQVYFVLQAIRTLGETRLAEIDRLIFAYLQDRESIQTTSFNALNDHIKANSATIIDVRPESEYMSGHITNSMSIPLSQLEDRIDEIPSNSKTIVYSRGPYCLLADEAIKKLAKYGIEAHRLELGFPDWRLAGNPVESISSHLDTS